MSITVKRVRCWTVKDAQQQQQHLLTNQLFICNMLASHLQSDSESDDALLLLRVYNVKGKNVKKIKIFCLVPNMQWFHELHFSSDRSMCSVNHQTPLPGLVGELVADC